MIACSCAKRMRIKGSITTASAAHPCISVDEFKKALIDMHSQLSLAVKGKMFKMTHKDTLRLLSTADKNSDGKVDITEATALTHSAVEAWFHKQRHPPKAMRSALAKMKTMGLISSVGNDDATDSSPQHDWEEHVDDDGHTYYWDVTSGNCQWEMPDVPAHLIKHIDDKAQS